MTYPIGTPGQKWGPQENQQWFELQTVKRSYQEQVVSKIQALADQVTIDHYGTLDYPNQSYSLYAMRSNNFDESKPSVLITGGVHGYETSGVQGAIRFVESQLAQFQSAFNFVVLPCISPWGYETINRWNPNAIDPNRSFYPDSPAGESSLAMSYVESLGINFVMHIDLHETTDTDNTQFRPALSARDAIEQKSWDIPDGFYLVGDSENPSPAFQKAVVDEVLKVTHIAPSDSDNQLIGVPLEQLGVIHYTAKKSGLCMGMTNATYVTTTEVYPDSPKVDDENCILAQVAAVTGGLNHILSA
ncbi:M14 family metallocarboxypeptidase [Catenovulum sp. SM1970]|uniref:M14 family metallopeptidase n=1 Tax=Marinifaba aquimaris TaxID=2741323 RepID=UPI001572FBFB|nr:M14 family metallocarboxypeptidase [Marinifaba aquimaris]NTS77122.1 M14 family metallocarboxypeptidase [Marinifaba aquimaris]